MDFALILSVKSSFSHILNQTKNASPRDLFVCTPVSLLGLLLQCINAGDFSKRKLMNLLLIWCYLEFWSSSSVWLLLLTFQCSQIAAPCILSRFYNGIQWERKDGVHLFHLITHPHTLRTEYDLRFCQIKCIC